MGENLFIEIYTDISTDIPCKAKTGALSCGAMILRQKKLNSEVYSTLAKSLILFKSENSNEAELLAGLSALEFLESEFGSLKSLEIRWFIDIPHIREFILRIIKDPERKKKIPQGALKYLDALNPSTNNEFGKISCELPQSISEKKRHHLCHRACLVFRQELIKLNFSEIDEVTEVAIKNIQEKFLRDWSLQPLPIIS